MPLNAEAFARCVNLSDQAFYVLDKGLSSYADLDSHLTLEDAITMIESHQVSQHNKALLKELQDELSNGR